jgi:MFS transporter, OPA family, sugar phosphate sensor protein UhpC
MNILDKLKRAPHRKEIEDKEKVKENYKYWRIRIFYGMYVGYIFYYFTRKSLTFAMPLLIADLGFTKADIGGLASILSLTYGISKFFSGILSDHANPRYFMAFGLLITGVINILFGSFSSITFFAIFWGLNGFFQGWGWPPCARLLTHWYSQKERGTWWGFWNTSHNVGGALIPLVAAFCAQSWGWRYALYIPGVISILVAFFIMNRLRDTPQSLGLPPIEKFKNDHPAKIKDEHELSTKQIVIQYLIKNKYIWILSAAYFFVYIVRTAINDWSLLFLIENKGYSMVVAGTCIFSFEMGGMLGSLSAGFFSDRLCKGKRGPINVIFSASAMLALIAFWHSPAISPVLDSFILAIIGFFVFGPQMLIGIAAAELSSKKAAGSATGFVGLFAYIGAAAAGFPLGLMTEKWGWEGFFIITIICAGLSSLILSPLWSIKYNTDVKKKT